MIIEYEKCNFSKEQCNIEIKDLKKSFILEKNIDYEKSSSIYKKVHRFYEKFINFEKSSLIMKRVHRF